MTNPRDYNNTSAVTTRSGKSLEVYKDKPEKEDQFLEMELEIKENVTTTEEEVTPKQAIKEKPTEPKPIIKLPFPTMNKKNGQNENFFEKFLEMFRKLEINIPFSEALEQMPIYAKFMKDIISKKGTIDTEPILLTIRDRSLKKALIDLGDNVSLMPLSIYKKLGI